MAYAPLPTLADLKRRLGIPAVSTQDEQLQQELDVAIAYWDDRCYSDPAQPAMRPVEVGEAMLMRAGRLFARRNSPEGVAGWGELGVVRVLPDDPDERALTERHLDVDRWGVA